MKNQITIGVGNVATTAKEYINDRKHAERGETAQEKNRLHFESLEIRLKELTPGTKFQSSLLADQTRYVRHRRTKVSIVLLGPGKQCFRIIRLPGSD
jgi:hypothetical protein